LHARDAASAFRIVLTHPDANGFFNVGHPDASRLRDTLTILRDLVNPPCGFGIWCYSLRSDQVLILQAHTKRLADLGWARQVDLREGFRETVAWYVDP
jgi:UDP-glucose 4-epimerase